MDIKISIFKDRNSLLKGVKERKPDIVLFDLYSKDPDTHEDINEHKSRNNVACICGANSTKTEDVLKLMQNTRNKARDLLNSSHFTSGIKDVDWFLSSSDITISFPVAMFTRYGRQLLSTEEVMNLQKGGVYFVWKNKAAANERDHKDYFSTREFDSLQYVIRFYSESVSRISYYLESSRLAGNKNYNKNVIAKKVFSYAEALFIFVVILTSISNLEGFLGHSHVELAKYFYRLLSVPWLSIFMLVSTLIYVVLKYCLKYSNIQLEESYTEIRSLIKDVINTKGVGK